MKISIMGLGYVGAVSAGCLARDGHEIIGVDPDVRKVELINQGNSPIIEQGLGELISEGVKTGRLSATTDAAFAMANTDLTFICVGTPSQINGSLDLKFVRRVCEQIGESLKLKGSFHVVVARSTMLPGTMREVIIPTLEAYSEKTAGSDFGICINPEFLREGTAVYDFYNPPKIVIGEIDKRSGDFLKEIYKNIDAPLIRTDLATTEMLKYTDNVWHALKVDFANEIGNICKAMNIDSHQVMEIFCEDKKLNLSPYYLKPGFAFGGSCLPKDVRALMYKSKVLDLKCPVIDSIITSNRVQIERGIDLIISKGKRKIAILGFSFKAGTDDLRESPMVMVIEQLIGKGYELSIYDKNVNLASISGANKDFLLNSIPHISKLMVESMEEAISKSDIIVIGNAGEEFKSVMNKVRNDQSVIDFIRINREPQQKPNYEGICW